MKRIILILIVLALANVVDARTYGVFTGCSNYASSQVQDLNQSTKDAKTLHKFYKGLGASTTLLTGKYATRDNIIARIRQIASNVTAGDDVVFFYSGHGAPDRMATYDGDGNKMLTYKELINELSRCNCKRIFIYVDACFSGSIGNALGTKDLNSDDWVTMMKEANGTDKFIVMLSSRKNEQSIEAGLLGAGFFSRSLFKGLKGHGDGNEDKQITVMELFKYIYNDVLLHSDGLQHPQLITSKSFYDSVVINWNKKKN